MYVVCAYMVYDMWCVYVCDMWMNERLDHGNIIFLFHIHFFEQ